MKKILDPCCGSKKFYFDKNNPLVLFGDKREETIKQCDGRVLEIKPDLLMDFTDLPFNDETFSLVIFDPPHLVSGGDNAFLIQAYGRLPMNWQDYLRKGFRECWRVLKTDGTLVFKWAERDIKLNDVCKCFGIPPVCGNKRPNQTTHWLVFFKG